MGAGKQISALQSFNKMRKFKKMVVTMIATQMKEKDIEDLRTIFKGLDKDFDGTLSRAELAEGLKQCKLSEEEKAALIAHLDTDQSGSIDYSEVIASTLDRAKYNKQELLWSAFRAF